MLIDTMRKLRECCTKRSEYDSKCKTLSEQLENELRETSPEYNAWSKVYDKFSNIKTSIDSHHCFGSSELSYAYWVILRYIESEKKKVRDEAVKKR